MKTGYAHLRCGLIGAHLGHSFSKEIHAHLADYPYELVELEASSVGDFVKDGGLDAFNVTIPYKKTVIPFLDRLSPEAERIGSVNTVVRQKDGSLFGYNTDYFGFLSMLIESGIEVKDKKVLVLGSGGASLTVQAVLSDCGAREIVVVGRSLENNYQNLYRHVDADVIVNTTPVGMYPNNGISPVELSEFPVCRGVLDLIYNPAKTALLLQAEERSIPHANGLRMLVAQAAKAFEYFTGDTVETDAIDRTAKAIERQTQNVVLIGMPSCGKSTVGKLLAKQMRRPFVDADEAFTSMHGLTPAEAITTLGENRFRELEHEVLEKLGKESGLVLACGGGAVTREYNYPVLHQNALIVYLERDLQKLSAVGRPLSQGRPIEQLYAERKDAYERFADLRVRSTEIPEDTAALILHTIT